MVSVVPPVYYAHLVGRRARFHTRIGASGDPTDDSASSIGNTGNTMGTDEAAAAEDAMVAAYAPVRPTLQKSTSPPSGQPNNSYVLHVNLMRCIAIKSLCYLIFVSSILSYLGIRVKSLHVWDFKNNEICLYWIQKP